MSTLHTRKNKLWQQFRENRTDNSKMWPQDKFCLHASDGRLRGNNFQSTFDHNTGSTRDGMLCHKLKLTLTFGVCGRNVKQCHIRLEHCSARSAAISATGRRYTIRARWFPYDSTYCARRSIAFLDSTITKSIPHWTRYEMRPDSFSLSTYMKFFITSTVAIGEG